MKQLLVVLLLASLTAGCTSRTEFGDCIGLMEKEKPNLEYKLSAWNLFIGIFFAELIIPPIIVIVDEVRCPVGRIS